MKYSPVSQQYEQAYGYSQPQQSYRPPQQSYKSNDYAQSHTVTHPHIREMYSREAPLQLLLGMRLKVFGKLNALTECYTEVMRLRGIGATEKILMFEDTLKINQLYLKIDRLNKCLLDISLELDQYKHKLYMATDKQARQQAEIDIDKMRAIMVENEAMLNKEIVRLRDQNEELSKRYRILELSMADSRHQLSIKEYEATLSQLRQEIDRAQFSINSQRAETEEWNLKYQRLEAQLSNLLNMKLKLEDQMRWLIIVIEKLNRLNQILNLKMMVNYKICNSILKDYKMNQDKRMMKPIVQDLKSNNKNQLLSIQIIRLENQIIKFYR